MSDNYRFRVDGETQTEFEAGMKLAYRLYNDRPATHFAITPRRGMILYDFENCSSPHQKRYQRC